MLLNQLGRPGLLLGTVTSLGQVLPDQSGNLKGQINDTWYSIIPGRKA